MQKRQFLDGGFVLLANNQVGFAIADYDHTHPLVIDPALVYSTFLEGANDANALRIAVDGSGNAYVVGETSSSDFPTSTGAYQPTFGGGTCTSANAVTQPCNDVFITKLNASGTALDYSTYLGGSNAEEPTGIAIDNAGNAYVTGVTFSSNFPTTPSAFQSVFGGGQCDNGFPDVGPCADAFLTELNASGSALLYSTYLGGSGPTNSVNVISGTDAAVGIALDSSGNAYVAGLTASSNFPTTAGAFQTSLAAGTCTINGLSQPCPDAFVTKFNPTASGKASVVYSTLLGGNGIEDLDIPAGNGNIFGAIAVDSSGDAYITGNTTSTNFPVTPGAFQSATSGGNCTIYGRTGPCGDAFVAKLNPTGTALLYATYLGGSGDDASNGIALDSSGNAYVTGFTTSRDYPITAGAFQTTFGGGIFDAFVSKINSTGSALVYSTYLGGNADENAAIGSSDIAVDSSGNAFITGSTNSTNFPTASPLQTTLASTSGSNDNGVIIACPDAFVAVLNAAGSNLIFSTYLGGRGADQGNGIALDSSGDIYVTGQTASSDFPITDGALETSFSGSGEAAFVTKITRMTPATVAASPISLTFSQQVVTTTSAAQKVTLTNNTASSVTLLTIGVTGRDAGDFTAPTAGSTCSTAVPILPGGHCDVNVTFAPAATGGRSALLQVTTNSASTPSLSVPLSGTGISAAVVSLSPSSVTFGNQLVGTKSAVQTVTLTNTGTGGLAISAVATTVADFAVSAPSTPGPGACQSLIGSTLAAGSSCRIIVSFSPSTAGLTAASLEITDDAADSPHSVALSGTGEDYSLVANVNSLKISEGQSATFTLSVTPQGGFNQAVSLACTGAPPKASCSASPSSITPDGTNPASTTFTVTTIAPTLVPPPVPTPPPPGGWPAALWLALPALLALAMLTCLDWRAPCGSRLFGIYPLHLVPLAALLLGLALWASCGSGGMTHTRGTPEGSYTLTITGTSSSLKHSATVTLAVN